MNINVKTERFPEERNCAAPRSLELEQFSELFYQCKPSGSGRRFPPPATSNTVTSSISCSKKQPVPILRKQDQACIKKKTLQCAVL